MLIHPLFSMPQIIRFHLVALTTILFMSSAPLFAQGTSAGSILQNIGRSDFEYALPEAQPNIRISPSEKPINSTAQTFFVKQFIFVGNQKVPSLKLQAMVVDYLYRQISLADLRVATDSITEYYRESGLLVRTQIPPQDVTDGQLRIEILEASLGDIVIENKSLRISNDRVEEWIYTVLPRFATILLGSLDRALLTLNDQPDILVEGRLQEGSHPGESILVITVKDKPRFDAAFVIENYGQSSTGQIRETANLNINSPLGKGELINIYALSTEGSKFGRVALSLPLGRDGWRLGLNTSALTYQVINPSFNQLGANGSSSTSGADLTYPIIRSRPVNLFLMGSYNYSDLTNSANGEVVSQYNTSVIQGGLTGNLLDNLAGGGVNAFSVLISGGMVDLNNSPSLLSDLNGAQVNGSFYKIRYSANRIQSIGRGLSTYIGTSGQWANKNMDPSEQLYFGGPYSVRAYATGQGNASQGNLTTVELRQALSSAWLFSVFYDYASLQTLINSNFSSAPQDNTYAMQGLGSSISWIGPLGFQLKAIWAMRTGSLPASITQTFSGNGGTSTTRFWLTASMPI